MNAGLLTALALAGVLTGPGQRIVIFRLAGPAAGERGPACPVCGHRFPGAWRRIHPGLLASNRCTACGVRAGPPPLAIELTTALLLTGLGIRLQAGFVLAAAAWLAVCAVPLAWIDAVTHRLPDALTAAAYAGTMALLLLAAATTGHWHNLVRAVLGGLALSGGYFALALIAPPGSAGGGDAKLGASVGTILAWFGWAALLGGALAGLLAGGIYGAALLALRRGTTRKHPVAFGGPMLTGAFLIILAASAAQPLPPSA